MGMKGNRLAQATARFVETVMTEVDPYGRLLYPQDTAGYQGRAYGLCLCTGEYSKLEFGLVFPKASERDRPPRFRIEFKVAGPSSEDTVICSHVFSADDTSSAVEWVRKCLDVLDAYPTASELLS